MGQSTIPPSPTAPLAPVLPRAKASAPLWLLWQRAKLAPLLRRPAVAGLVASLTAWAMLGILGGGGDLNDIAFFSPLARLRHALGLGTPISDDFRLIVADDQTVQVLGRVPTFSEWHEIASLLTNAGHSRLLLQGNFNLAGDSAYSLAPHSDVRLHTTVTLSAEADSSRALDATDFPARMFLQAATGQLTRPPGPAPLVIGPHRSLYQYVTGLGTVEVGPGNRVGLGQALSRAIFVPNLALWAAKDLMIVGDRIVTDGKAIPRSYDSSYVVDFLPAEALLSSALPAHAFFVDGKVVGVLNSALRQRLGAARVVVMVPDAFTGTRFLESPLGRVPAFTAFASLVNGVLQHHFVYEPWPPHLVIAIYLALLTWLSLRISLTWIVAAEGLLLGASFAFAIAGNAYFGWVMPETQLALVTVAAMTAHLGLRFTAFAEKSIDLAKDLEMGQLIQRHLLPNVLSGHFGGWSFKVVLQPFGHLSGDWAQIYTSPEGEGERFAAIAIGDVVGKGSSAALVTAMISCMWHAFFDRKWTKLPQVGDFLNELNSTIYSAFQGIQYTTLSMAILHKDEIILIACGAPPWWDINVSETKTMTLGRLNPIGLEETATFKFGRRAATPGQTYFAHTDGVMDGVNYKREFKRKIAEMPRPAGDQIFPLIEAAAFDSAREDVLPDDATLLMFSHGASAPA